MNLPAFSVRHPVVVSILLVVLLVFGTLAFMNLNREMMPPMGLPQAHVITTWPGAGAEDVEQAITRQIENQLSTLGGMSAMTSTSKDSFSIVQLEFADGTDVFSRLPEIRELLNVTVPDLPEDIDGQPEIIISEANGLLPIFSFQVDSVADPVELARFLDDEVAPRLARIPGVARINVVGAAAEEVRVMVDPDRIRAREIAPLAILNALRYGNADIPAGEVDYQGRELPLTAEGAFATLADIRNLVVGNHDSAFVRLGDVAEVETRTAEPDVTIRSGGENTVVVDVLKRDDGNTIEIVTQARRVLDEIARENPGLFAWRTVSNHQEMTDRSINTVITSALIGTLLATLMILLFLHDIRATVIIAVSIPLSVLFAFAAMYLTGRTINLLTLSGITVAIGMIVDASIVTLENTWKHYRNGGDRLLAAELGAGEVGSAILASTLTSISAFAPLAFLSGIIGIIMSDLSLTIVYTLAASAVVAVGVVPFLSSILLRPEHAPRKHRFITRLDTAIDARFGALQSWYQRILQRTLDDSRFVFLLALAILAASVLLLTALPVSFLPPTDTGEFEIHIETPRTYSRERTQTVVDEIDRIVTEIVPEKAVGVYYIGASSALAIAGSPNQAFGRVRLVEGALRERSVQELIPLVQHALDRQIPEADITVLNGGFDALLGLATGGQGYQIEIYGTRLEDVVAVAELAREQLATDPDVLKAETNTTFDAEQLYLTLSQEQMGTLGISAYQAGLTARVLMTGIVAGTYTPGEQRIPLRLVSSLAEQALDRDTVHRISLPNSEGITISYAAFSEIVPRQTVSTINKRDRAISATVRGYLYNEDQSGVSLRTETMLNSLNLPPGVGWQRAGTSQLILDSMKSLSVMLALAIFLVYVVMVIQFERYLQPLIIMAAVPFSLIGVVLGLRLFSSALSVIAMLGLITLGGTVVNNAIVMVDHINTLRRRDGLPLREALLEGASGRLRPILMTTLTTLFAVLPMALSVGDGSEIYAPLGQAIFGGLLTSTAITLFLIPLLYQAVERRKHPRATRRPGAAVILLVLGMMVIDRTPVTAEGPLEELRRSATAQSSELAALLTFDEVFTGMGSGGTAVSPPVDVQENREIALWQSRRAAAGADRAAARALRFPSITARADSAWIANPAEAITLAPGELGTIPLSRLNPLAADVALPEAETELFEGSGASRYELGLTLVQPIYAWGTIENRIAAAVAAEQLAAYTLAGIRHAIALEVQATAELITILQAMEQILALQGSAAERLVEISRENWTNGFITEAQYLDAQLARQEVLLARAEIAESQGNARARLQILTGSGADTGNSTDTPVTEISPAGTIGVTPEALIEQALAGSWELRGLEAVLAARIAQERVATGSRTLRPDVGFRADFSWVGALEEATAATWEERGTWQLTLGVGISDTLFDGGRAAAAHTRAGEETVQAALELARRGEDVAAAVRTHLRRLATLQARLEHTTVVLAVRTRETSDAQAALVAGAGGEDNLLRTIISHAAAITEGYEHLAAYRGELWSLAVLLGKED